MRKRRVGPHEVWNKGVIYLVAIQVKTARTRATAGA
jgi:hypothetical protein